MALFQKSVLNKYLKEQNEKVVGEAFVKFQTYFSNPTIQQNIRESKEEQFQQKTMVKWIGVHFKTLI